MIFPILSLDLTFNMLLFHLRTIFCYTKVLLFRHKDGHVDREEQEADERVRDPLHDGVMVQILLFSLNNVKL